MASVAKWLRQWFVVPPSGGSSPLVRPLMRSHFTKLKRDRILIVVTQQSPREYHYQLIKNIPSFIYLGLTDIKKGEVIKLFIFL